MDFRDLNAYENAFDLAVPIHEASNKFPKEERYSLTDTYCLLRNANY